MPGWGELTTLIATSRTEVRQAAETITTVGGQAVANSPVLSALNERLETSLAPRLAQMQQALGPVRDAVGEGEQCGEPCQLDANDGRACAAAGGAWTKLSTGLKGCPRMRRNCAGRCGHWWGTE